AETEPMVSRAREVPVDVNKCREQQHQRPRYETAHLNRVQVDCRPPGRRRFPRAETAGRIEPCAAAIRTPERLYEHILCCASLAHDAENPAIDVPLVVSEQALEGVLVATDEPIKQF